MLIKISIIYCVEISLLEIVRLPYQQIWMLSEENGGDIENVFMER